MLSFEDINWDDSYPILTCSIEVNVLHYGFVSSVWLKENSVQKIRQYF